MKAYFKSRGYDEKYLVRTIGIVRKMTREELLSEKESPTKDPHTVFVCTWHPKLKQLPNILVQNNNSLSTDAKLCKTFTSRSTVAFRRKKNLSNYLCKNDIRNKRPLGEEKCKGCKLCKIMSTNKTITNKNKNISFNIKPGANCKTKGIIYAVNCKKCEKMYIGHTGDSMSERFSKHKYDIINRPEQNELAAHCHKDHDLENGLEVFILEHGIPLLQHRKLLEDKYICKLQTCQPNGMNVDLGPYGKEMYECWASALKP